MKAEIIERIHDIRRELDKLHKVFPLPGTLDLTGEVSLVDVHQALIAIAFEVCCIEEIAVNDS